MNDENFKPLNDPMTRESAEAAVIDALRSVGGEDPEGWEVFNYDCTTKT